MVPLGVYDAEKEAPQEIAINVSLTWEADKKHSSDQLGDVVDYDSLIVQPILKKWPLRAHTQLIEKLAEDAIELCFKDYRVMGAEVSITKTQAYSTGTNPVVSLRRHRGQVVN